MIALTKSKGMVSMTNISTMTLGAVTLNVNNIKLQSEFYQKVIGLHIIEESEKKVSLGIKETIEELVILEALDPAKNRERVTGLYHLVILLPTRGALGGVLRHLIEVRAQLQGASDHGYSEALYLQDPEGNGIEIYRDKDRSEWDTQENGIIRGITIEMDIEGVLAAGPVSTPYMPEGTIMGHVHLTGTNFPANEIFYKDLLGFNLTDDLGGHARFFGMDGYHHQVGVNNWLGNTILHRKNLDLGIKEYQINWGTKEIFTAVKDRLEQANYELDIMNEFEFKTLDPNGIMVHMGLQK